MEESVKSQLQARVWDKDEFLISTNPETIPIPRLIDVFASNEFYWAKALPPSAMRQMLENSLCFGMYQRQPIISGPGETPPSNHTFIGIARCVTDFTTFVYLTDVWVDPSYQGHGLGSWLVKCVQEVIEGMPHLRRSMLFTADWGRSVPFYEKLMGMKVIEGKRGEGLAVMERKGMGHPSFGVDSTGYD